MTTDDKTGWNMAVKIRKGLRIVKRGEVWYREERINGRPVRVSLGTADEKEALRKAIAGPEEVPAPRPFLKGEGESELLTLGEALDEYKAWYEKNRRSSVRTGFAVDPFVDSVGEDFRVAELTRDHLQKWLDSRVDGRAAVTVRNDFARVRAFLRWVGARKDLPALFNLCRGIDQPKDEAVTREAPSVEKVRAVLRKLAESGHPWLHDYARVLAETGMRPSELLGLRGCDVRGKLVSIVPWEGRLLKSHWSRRVLEVSDAAAAILGRRKEAMLDKTRPIFATSLGTVYQEKTVMHLFQALLAGCRGKPVPEELRMTLYDFRHFFASEHAAPGSGHMAIESLGAYLGHSPSSVKVLLRWYADANALRRGAPVSVLGTPREGKVISMGGK